MARSPHTGLPIPKGGSLSTPLGHAVESLAGIWRATRADEVIPKLVVLSDAYASFFPRLPKKGHFFARLVELAPDRMLSVLLRSITHGSDESAASRLMAVWTAWGADPRIWPYLERWTKVATYPRGTAFHTALEIVLDAWDARRAEQTQTPARALGDSDRAALGHASDLIASLTKRRTALSLLNDVYQSPTDVARRLVFADALMDLGDPWGELIAIQCADSTPSSSGRPSSKQREAQLLAAGRVAWIGRLLPWVREDTVVFEGGFPAKLTPLPLARAAGVPEWSTVRELVDRTRNFRPVPELFTLGLLSRMPRLRSASIIVRTSPGHLPQPQGGQGIEHLTVRFVSEHADEQRELLEAWAFERTLPALERLEIVNHGLAGRLLVPAVKLLESRFGRRLRELAFMDPITALVEWSAPLIARRAPFPAIHSLQDGSSIELDAGSRALTLRIAARADMAAIGTALRRAAISSLRVEAAPSMWSQVEGRRWQAALEGTKVELVRA